MGEMSSVRDRPPEDQQGKAQGENDDDGFYFCLLGRAKPQIASDDEDSHSQPKNDGRERHVLVGFVENPVGLRRAAPSHRFIFFEKFPQSVAFVRHFFLLVVCRIWIRIWIWPDYRARTIPARDVLLLKGASRIYFDFRQSHQEIIKENKEFLMRRDISFAHPDDCGGAVA
ncbi:MAG: hypothetical protein LBI62_10390 [Candidatus Accumulibacter sp.]|nr:hypothetical protein [Accumulibacter sp.]